MSRDISHILDGWEYEPDQVSVRIVQGDDGRDKIQLRLDMGLLQMDLDGRPDGQRPEGRESWLDYYREQQQAHEASNPDSAPFLLDSEQCDLLLREGLQYYRRYLSFWHLRRYELCARDTNRNLRLFQFVREHARQDRDKQRFDQYRPYVTMMHARAVATPFLELGVIDAAVKAIDAGIRGIRGFLAEYDQLDRAAQCAELVHLERWREEIVSQQPKLEAPREPPPNTLEQLRIRLAEAIADERFEDAARLRDQMRDLPEGG